MCLRHESQIQESKRQIKHCITVQRNRGKEIKNKGLMINVHEFFNHGAYITTGAALSIFICVFVSLFDPVLDGLFHHRSYK
jgi:hypothetical protein